MALRRFHIAILGILSGVLLLPSCMEQTVSPLPADSTDNSSSSALPWSSGHSTPSSSSGSSSSGSASSSSVSPDSWAVLFVSLKSGVFTRTDGVKVQVSPFRMLKTEVPRSLYSDPDLATSSASFSKDLPQANVSWWDAVLFCNALSRSLGLDTAYSYSQKLPTGVLSGLVMDLGAHAVRLPTEAEWEYATRAGTSTDYFWGDGIAVSTVSRYAIGGNGEAQPAAVASLDPNPWGLYDMAGNLREWINDWFGSYDSSIDSISNPAGLSVGSERVVRGGSYIGPVTTFGSGTRDSEPSDATADDLGFRVVIPQ